MLSAPQVVVSNSPLHNVPKLAALGSSGGSPPQPDSNTTDRRSFNTLVPSSSSCRWEVHCRMRTAVSRCCSRVLLDRVHFGTPLR
jgi:hypothetical protein